MLHRAPVQRLLVVHPLGGLELVLEQLHGQALRERRWGKGASSCPEWQVKQRSACGIVEHFSSRFYHPASLDLWLPLAVKSRHSPGKRIQATKHSTGYKTEERMNTRATTVVTALCAWLTSGCLTKAPCWTFSSSFIS